jgi:hypothetical protein
MKTRAVLVVVALGLLTRDATAACVDMPLSYYMRDKGIRAVFRGTVTDLRKTERGEIATLAVTRVWKGDVLARQVIYNVHSPGDEKVFLQVGGDYFVRAWELSPPDQAEIVQSTNRPAYASGACSMGGFSVAAHPGLSTTPGHLPKPEPQRDQR